MRGFYTIRGPHGSITSENLITDKGKALILAFLAGDIAFWGDEIAVGVSEVGAALGDTSLGYEVGRAKVLVTEAVVSNNSVMLKATLPRDVIADIYEVGVFSSAERAKSTLPAAPLSDFDPTYMETTNLTADATNSRIGERGALLTAAAGTAVAGSFNNLRISLEARQSTDEFVLAYHNGGNAQDVEIRLYTSPTTYHSYSFAPALGYNVHRWSKDLFIPTTGANWIDTVSTIEMIVTAAAGGAASVLFDGLRVETPITEAEYGLVSRSILAAPITKGFDVELEIEYNIEFGW